MNLVILVAAEQDIVEQARYYAVRKRNLAVAERFLQATEATFDAIRDNPGLGAPKHTDRSELLGLRSWPIKGFSLLRIYYLETPGTVRIIRILHGRQNLESIMENESDD